MEACRNSKANLLAQKTEREEGDEKYVEIVIGAIGMALGPVGAAIGVVLQWRGLLRKLAAVDHPGLRSTECSRQLVSEVPPKRQSPPLPNRVRRSPLQRRPR